MEKLAANWVAENCRFASGVFGKSRVYDRCIHCLAEAIGQGLKVLSRGDHVAVLAFSKDAKPEHQIVVSWLGKGPKNHPGITVDIQENTPDKFLLWGPQAPGRYVIRTDSLEIFPGNGYFSSLYSAHLELQKRVGVKLDPVARWGMALRFVNAQPTE